VAGGGRKGKVRMWGGNGSEEKNEEHRKHKRRSQAGGGSPQGSLENGKGKKLRRERTDWAEELSGWLDGKYAQADNKSEGEKR